MSKKKFQFPTRARFFVYVSSFSVFKKRVKPKEKLPRQIHFFFDKILLEETYSTIRIRNFRYCISDVGLRCNSSRRKLESNL